MFWKIGVWRDVLARSLVIYIYTNIKDFDIISSKTQPVVERILPIWIRQIWRVFRCSIFSRHGFFRLKLEGLTKEESQETSVQIGKDQLSIVEKVSWISLPKF